MCQAADLKVAIDERVKIYVEQLVDDGVQRVSEMCRNVCRFVRELFGDNPLPKQTNRRFYPSRQDLSGLMHRRRCSNLRGLLDQEQVQANIAEYQKQNPKDSWFFRPSSSSEDENVSSERLLLVHQTEWQQRLLLRYGQELVFLDATYRTTRYAIPLFFLCVHTNDGYVVVAIVLLEREDSASLAEALEVLKQQNPNWNPKGFMVDASEMEIAAINAAFTGLSILQSAVLYNALDPL